MAFYYIPCECGTPIFMQKLNKAVVCENCFTEFLIYSTFNGDIQYSVKPLNEPKEIKGILGPDGLFHDLKSTNFEVSVKIGSELINLAEIGLQRKGINESEINNLLDEILCCWEKDNEVLVTQLNKS